MVVRVSGQFTVSVRVFSGTAGPLPSSAEQAASMQTPAIIKLFMRIVFIALEFDADDYLFSHGSTQASPQPSPPTSSKLSGLL